MTGRSPSRIAYSLRCDQASAAVPRSAGGRCSRTTYDPRTLMLVASMDQLTFMSRTAHQ